MFSRNYRPTNNNTRDDDRNGANNRNGRTNSYRPRGSSTSSFPSSNRRTTLPVCCILCGEKGHPVGAHYNGNVPVPAKGSDGKSIWAKIINALLCTPDGRGLCINHNVRNCTITKCERAHVCSFCGSKITTPSHGHADLDHTPSTNHFLSMTSPSLLPYRNFYDTIIHRSPLSTNSIDSHNEIYNRIVQPYDPNTFEDLLLQHKLTYLYPLLVTNLRNGFPLGEMPSLTETVILENHPSAQQYPETVNQYLEDEVEAGRMDGPYSCDVIKSILRGPFFVSPLIVSVQPQGLGVPDKLRVCRHLSKSNKLTTSVNSHIKKEDFPTRFDTASRVADIVSPFSSSN
jgi:hypothetical protein